MNEQDQSMPDIEDNQPTGPLGFGRRLAEARLSAGLTVSDISKVLRIREPFVQALEREDLGALPDQAFAFSATRSLARLLGIEAQPLVDDIRRLLDAPAPEVMLQVQEPVLETERPAWMSVGLGLAIVLVVGMVTIFMSRQDDADVDVVRLPEKVQETIEEVDTALEIREAEQREEQALIGFTDSLAYEDDPLPPMPMEKIVVVEVDREPAPLPEWWRFNMASPLPRPTDEQLASAALTALLAAEEQALAMNAARLEPVILIARSRVWVSIEKDGQIFREEVLAPGTQVDIGDGIGYTLTVGNAGGVGVQIGPQQLEQIGARGEVLQKLPLDRNILLERWENNS